MKNIDKMKEALISKIKDMSIEEYQKINDFLGEQYDYDPESVDKNMIFSCNDCKNTFGNCPDDEKLRECHQRFVRYANSES